MPWALDVAKNFGLLGVPLFTQSCSVTSIYYSEVDSMTTFTIRVFVTWIA